MRRATPIAPRPAPPRDEILLAYISQHQARFRAEPLPNFAAHAAAALRIPPHEALGGLDSLMLRFRRVRDALPKQVPNEAAAAADRHLPFFSLLLSVVEGKEEAQVVNAAPQRIAPKPASSQAQNGRVKESDSSDGEERSFARGKDGVVRLKKRRRSSDGDDDDNDSNANATSEDTGVAKSEGSKPNGGQENILQQTALDRQLSPKSLPTVKPNASGSQPSLSGTMQRPSKIVAQQQVSPSKEAKSGPVSQQAPVNNVQNTLPVTSRPAKLLPPKAVLGEGFEAEQRRLVLRQVASRHLELDSHEVELEPQKRKTTEMDLQIFRELRETARALYDVGAKEEAVRVLQEVVQGLRARMTST